MKVVAMTKESHRDSACRYLVEMSNAEIGLLVRNEQFGIGKQVFFIGAELELHEAWQKINLLDHSKNDLMHASRNMRALADMLEREVQILRLPQESEGEVSDDSTQ